MIKRQSFSLDDVFPEVQAMIEESDKKHFTFSSVLEKKLAALLSDYIVTLAILKKKIVIMEMEAEMRKLDA